MGAKADFIHSVNFVDDASIFDYQYNESAVNLNSQMQTLIDQVTGYKIILTNLEGGIRASSKLTSFSMSVIDKDYKVLKIFKLPVTGNFYPFYVQNISFYPSKIMDSKVIHGTVVIKTTKGDIFLDLKTLNSEFIIYGKDFFENKTEEIKVTELKKK